MRILMATDGSVRSTAALESVARMFTPANREADLMCVIPHLGPGNTSRQQQLCQRAVRALERVQAVLSTDGLTVRPIVETGSAPRVLINAARGYDVTVIAATSHKCGPMAGLGPVASRLAEHHGGTTVVARKGRRDESSGLKALVTVDGSEGSIRALDALTALVDLTAAEVTLIHVTETHWLHADPEPGWLGPSEDEMADQEAQLQGELVREADEILDSARRRLPARLTVNTLVYEGMAADEILGEAERGDYDLVVLGASGATDLKHSMLGSVSSKVAWSAPCSVLLSHAADWR